jgi:hypothetical protein
MAREQHIRLLAWLFIIRGVLMLLGAIGTVIVCTLTGVFSGDLVETLVTPLVGVGVALVLFIFSLPSFLAGMGLLDGKGWARVLAMVLGALSIFDIPLGTALCVYTFWTLWGRDSDPYFEGRLAAAQEYDRN